MRTVLGDDWPNDGDRKLFDEIVELPPIEEVVATASVLERFAAQAELDGVLVQSEAALAPGAWLAAKLGLPGVGIDGALACLAKHVSRSELAAASVPVPAFRLASSAAEVREFARRHGFPILLKATASVLGRLVTKIDDEPAIEAAVARMLGDLPRSRDVRRLEQFARLARLELGCDPTREFLVESFFDGAPVETDGLVVGGRATTFGVLEQTVTEPPRFYVESYRLPADRPAPELERIEDVSRAAIRASRLDTAGFSIELRTRGSEIVVIEVNARLGEDDHFADLFSSALGFAPLEAAIELALGAREAPNARVRGHWSLAYRSGFVAGRVVGVPSELELAALEARDIRGGATVRVGDPWYVAPHPDAFPHLAWALASDPHSSRRAGELALEAARSLDVRIDPTARLE